MSAATTVVKTFLDWARLVIEVTIAVSPSMFIGTSVGVAAAHFLPGALAFAVAVVTGFLAFVAFRIGMATLLSPLMREATVEQWAIGR